jgi:hypothetical protein
MSKAAQITMAAVAQMFDDAANDKARAKVLTREIGMLKQAQPNLRGIPARHNLIRIEEREDELRSLNFLLALYEREDVVSCEVKAALESVSV